MAGILHYIHTYCETFKTLAHIYMSEKTTDDEHAASFFHRDLSWLAFNDRVLAEARDHSNPIFERLKFLGITSSNLDEFFMIRLASLNRDLRRALKKGTSGKTSESADLVQSISKIRSMVLAAVKEFRSAQEETLEELKHELGKYCYLLADSNQDFVEHHALAQELFLAKVTSHVEEVEQVSLHSVRKLENLQLAAVFSDGSLYRLRREAPAVLWTRRPPYGLSAFFLDDILLHFPQVLEQKESPLLLRLTRDADVTLSLPQEDPESIPDFIRKRVQAREKRKPMRLQFRCQDGSPVLDRIVSFLHLERDQVFQQSKSLLLHGLTEFVEQQRKNISQAKHLFFSPLRGFVPPSLQSSNDILSNLDAHDYLLHHPYDSFDAYIHFIEQAVADPFVENIQQTVYRVDALSRVLSLLQKAAETKKVRVLIEPRARFDEINNLRLAETLRRSGVEVIFASGKLKVHAKLAIVLRNKGEAKFYTHLSTGNYNANTAMQYADLAIISGNQEIGRDAFRFFDAACRGEVPEGFSHLVLAPTGLHRRILSLIRAETQAARNGAQARIFAKVNALVDEGIITALYEASQAGVHIDLNVRGACSLIPGIPGRSENIRVTSIVDRFLEHSRIYYFSNAERLYLSSADWMPRNFFSRLEIAFPVLDERLRNYLTTVVIPTYLSDNVKARVLLRSGEWKPLAAEIRGTYLRAQERFVKLARGDYLGTPLDYMNAP